MAAARLGSANSLQQQMGAAAGLLQMQQVGPARPGSAGVLHGQPSGHLAGPPPVALDRGASLQLQPQPSGGVPGMHKVPPAGGLDHQAQPSGGVPPLHHYHSDSVLEQRPLGLHPFNSSRCGGS